MGSRFRMAFYWDWVSIPTGFNQFLIVHLVSGAHFWGHPLVNWPFRMFYWPFQWIIISFTQDLMDLLVGMSANSIIWLTTVSFQILDNKWGYLLKIWVILSAHFFISGRCAGMMGSGGMCTTFNVFLSDHFVIVSVLLNRVASGGQLIAYFWVMPSVCPCLLFF